MTKKKKRGRGRSVAVRAYVFQLLMTLFAGRNDGRSDGKSNLEGIRTRACYPRHEKRKNGVVGDNAIGT